MVLRYAPVVIEYRYVSAFKYLRFLSEHSFLKGVLTRVH